MMIRWNRFNIYLLLALVLGLACGCRSPETKRKQAVTHMMFQLEVPRGAPGNNEQVQVYRGNPMLLNVQKEPFLTDANVLKAKVLDDVGGFSIEIQFDRDGTILLEQRTVANRGGHYAIVCQWAVAPDWQLNTGRCLAAPQFNRRITNGLIVFTPDATREEADEIVIGLNNVAKATHGPGFD